MTSCSAQCVPCSTGSGWVEITKCICTVLSQLTSNSLQTTAKMENDRGSMHMPDKTRGTESWSDVNSYSIYRIRTNSSLIFKCKIRPIFHQVVSKCPDTSAPVPKCLADNSALVLKCLGSEVSGVRSVCTPLTLVSLTVLHCISWVTQSA